MGRKIQFFTGEVYHVYNRGTDKRVIFDSAGDYLRFLDGLTYFNTTEPIGSLFEFSFNKENTGKPLVEILAYNILPNHYHLVLRQLEEGGVSRFMKSVGGGYAKYYNEKNSRNGVLFQGPFKAKHIASQEYLEMIMAYVNLNHKAHGLGNQVSKWSSLQDFQYGKAMNGEIVAFQQTSKDRVEYAAYVKRMHDLMEKTIQDRENQRKQRYKTGIVDLMIE